MNSWKIGREKNTYSILALYRCTNMPYIHLRSYTFTAVCIYMSLWTDNKKPLHTHIVVFVNSTSTCKNISMFFLLVSQVLGTEYKGYIHSWDSTLYLTKYRGKGCVGLSPMRNIYFSGNGSVTMIEGVFVKDRYRLAKTVIEVYHTRLGVDAYSINDSMEQAEHCAIQQKLMHTDWEYFRSYSHQRFSIQFCMAPLDLHGDFVKCFNKCISSEACHKLSL